MRSGKSEVVAVEVPSGENRKQRESTKQIENIEERQSSKCFGVSTGDGEKTRPARTVAL